MSDILDSMSLPDPGDPTKFEIEIDEPPKFKLVSAREIASRPVKVDWLINGIMERQTVCLLFGEPGACKSLFAMDWGFCIARGINWHGHKTKQSDVVLIAGEGHSGMTRRLKALESKYGEQTPERFFISERPANLTDEVNVKFVVDAIKELSSNPGLIIVDTLHRNMIGDENSSRDIGAILQYIDAFIKPLGATVLLVHHSGHGDKTRSRGSSSIKGGVDAEYSASKDSNAVVLSNHKMKDGAPFAPMQFSINEVELGRAEDDEAPATSAYLEHQGEAKLAPKKPKLSTVDEKVLQALTDAIDRHGIDPTPEIKAKFAGPGRLGWANKKVVRFEFWREQAYKFFTLEGDDKKSYDAQRMAFNRARKKLIDQKLAVEYTNHAWRIL